MRTKNKKKRATKKLTLINFKVTSKDRAILKAKAKKNADGNLSAWLIRAGKNYSARASK